MATKIILLLAAIGAVVAVPHKSLKRPNHDHIDYYDCSGKTNGSYMHPTDCTRFIMCSNGYAADMACPDCNGHDPQCDGEAYLRWSEATGNCEWPADTECVTADSDPCPGIVAGGNCGKNDCKHCGFCTDKMSQYYRCNRTFPSDPKLEITGKWVLESCDADLWWDPDLKPSSEVEEGIGGACNRWENLSPATKEKWRTDVNCKAVLEEVCLWGQDEGDKCSERYWYYDPKTMTVREDLACPGGLLWDQATETCRSCGNIAGCECK